MARSLKFLRTFCTLMEEPF